MGAFIQCERLNPLSNGKILDLSELKPFADDSVDMTQKIEFFIGRGRKQSGQRRKCYLPAFSPFST